MGFSVSQVLKNGVLALRDQLASRRIARPFDVYKTIDLGPGGYLKAPARNAKRTVADIVRRKLGR
jgi:mitochondrial fission protein ELM1